MGNITAFYRPLPGLRAGLGTADRNTYSDGMLFREEQENVFRPSWLVACHESEMPNAYDYCTFSHPAGPFLFVIRGQDRSLRGFYNVCPHHGVSLLPGPSGMRGASPAVDCSRTAIAIA